MGGRPMGWWLWIAFPLFPRPAFPFKGSIQPSEVGPTKPPQETKNGVFNQTETPETGRMWVTSNSSQPPERGWETITKTTPFHNTLAERITEYKTRRLAKPSITVRSVNGTCNVSADCAVSGEEGDVSYRWLHAATEAVLSKGPNLWVTQKPPDGSLDFICTVQNEESKNSSTVSLKDHCQGPSSLSQGTSASFYAKYLTPPLVVLVLLFALFFMYRRKRGIGNRSRTVSINESSDSEEEDCPRVATTEQPNFPSEAFKPISEETLQTTEALTSSNDDEILDPQDPHPSQA